MQLTSFTKQIRLFSVWLPFFVSLLVSIPVSVLTTQSEAIAKYARVDTEEVPVQRLLTNLESKAHASSLSDQDAAALEYQIGRLHSMAYAQKTEVARVRKSGPGVTEPSDLMPFYGFGPAAQHQFNVSATTDQAAEKSAADHLNQAIEHLHKSLSLDSNSLAAKLCFAWCLDQRGDKTQALANYREVFREAWQSESQADGGLRGSSIAAETASYLIALLDPAKDAAEVADIQQKSSHLQTVFRAMTPIVIPLIPNMPPSSIMGAKRINFDLDGNGLRSYSLWPRNGKAAWLVYDAGNRGEIRSGLQLFGDKTFWVFWKDGYEALSALDNDHDGKVDGAELNHLALWQDLNQDGRSQAGEVQSLARYGIKSLSCASAVDANGMPFSRNGVIFEDGSMADSYDWILRGE